jgi:hypothetical protein
MKLIIWTRLAAAGCVVAMLLAAPRAQAQPVAGTEAGATMAAAKSAGNALIAAAYFAPSTVGYNREEVCVRLRAVKGLLHELNELADRAGEQGQLGQLALASRLDDLGDDLADLVWEVEEDYGCWPVEFANWERPAGAQPFVGGYFGGGFQSTNFSVSDTGFNVNGSGFLGGGFGGVLLPIPNTNAQAGFRVGGQGSNITGSVTSPADKVTTNWTTYQEAIASVPIPFSASTSLILSSPDITSGSGITARTQALTKYFFQSFASVGVAESGTSVKGTSGTSSVTDNVVRIGITFAAGVTVPVYPSVDLFAQYRGTQWISRVNIPSPVPIGSYTNEVDLGLQWRFSIAPPPPP